MDRVPVLKIGDILLVSIQVDLEDQTALQLQEDLADRIVATGCHGVIIDISAMDIVDSFIGRMLSTIASISRVLDAETVVVGMRPAVAITLVELGLSLNGIRTALNVERGMDLIAAARTEAEGGHADEAAEDPPPWLADRPGSGSSNTGGTAPDAGPWAATKP
ncbi:STAS domain-containing protein [Solwaraspora sp. WMMD1047]|uniref:STAS domain-containing protein n=1 Tax=Solwaraspora sp. WMMD1047 TaxID=3016102 RepID=UPI002416DBDA|nr:STAS domain-containing protein [Solwaraspora sp. WMMD1047]MDG4827882.1 STAS domain-containing protein [Solwaraspora sp. WMMD1047]